MGELDASTAPRDQGIQLSPEIPPSAGSPGALCSCGCGGQATRGSGYRWAYVHDPDVPEDQRLAGRRLGGRRGAMTPAEVVRLLEGADLGSREGRQMLRDRFLRLRLGGKIGTGVYRDLLAAVDGAAKDTDRNPAKAKPEAILVEVQSFDPNGPGA